MRTTNMADWGSLPISLKQMSFFDKLFVVASFAGALVLSFPHVTAAQIIQEKPFVFQVNEMSLGQASGTQRNFLGDALAGNIPPIIEDPRVILLRTFLESKDSPLAVESQILLQQYHYRLIIGISFAESNFCKVRIRPNNCWGIGGSRPETYDTMSDGIIRANNLIQKYQNNGMTSPKLMRTTWVGWQNASWPIAVEQVTTHLENLGL
ncbi:MAG: hypothetical protein Q8R08_02095 [bacterium]|nr:hypothetical protein [bacterium]